MATPVMPGGKPIPGPITAGDELAKKAAEDAAKAASDAAVAKADAEAKRLAAFNNAQLQEYISMVLALKDRIDPKTGQPDSKLQEAWDAYIRGDVDGFRSAILDSDFFKNNNSLARTRAQAKVSQPGVWADDLSKYKAKQKNRLVGVGVKWSAALDEQLNQAYDLGIDDDDYLDDILFSAGVIGELGGSTLGTVTTLKAYANSFGVSSLLDDNYWNSKSRRLFSQDMTEEDIQKDIRDLSASAFPAYADGINSGVSLASQGSSVIQTFARFLEEDPDTLSFDDPDIRQVMQYVDPVTGKPARMPQWMTERKVKKNAKWAFTNNARDTIDSLSLQVFRDMGLA